MEITHLPKLTTERLLLRPISPDDAHDMYEYAKNPIVGPRAGWKPHESFEESLSVIFNMADSALKSDNVGVLAIVERESGKMIGTVGIHKFNSRNGTCEIGYVLNPDFWGRSIMLEAVSAVIAWLFSETEMYRIECGHYDFNRQSQRVIEKLGFKHEGTAKRKILLMTGERCDLHYYGMLRDDFEAHALPWQKKEGIQ